MSSSTNPGQAQPQQMQATNIASQGVLPTPEPSVPPDDRRNEAENQRQQAQPQQLQGINNTAAQGGLPTQPSSPPNDNEAMDTAEAADVEEFLHDMYNKAQGPLGQAYNDPFEFDWEQLDKWNDEIKDRNIERGFFDKALFQDTFTEAWNLREEMRNADETAYKTLYDQWRELTERYTIRLSENDYPDWTLPEPTFQQQQAVNQQQAVDQQQSMNQQQPPPPADAPKILAHREMRNGNEYYVEKMMGNLPYCEIETEARLGPSAVRAYLSSDKKVSVTDHSMKYRKKDYERFGGVLHVACKPVHTRIVKNDGRKPRRPPTTVQILFDDKPTWVVYSDMKNMMGDEADGLIRGYYRRRNLECPWDIKPKRRLKVIEDDEDTEPEAADRRSPQQATKAVPSVNATKQMDLVMAQLQTLTLQMNEMQKLNMQLMQGMLRSQGPVIKQENQGEVEQL